MGTLCKFLLISPANGTVQVSFSVYIDININEGTPAAFLPALLYVNRIKVEDLTMWRNEEISRVENRLFSTIYELK